MSYLVHRIDAGLRPSFGDPLWRRAEIAAIACFPWDENGFRPVSQGRCLWNEDGIHILLESWEKDRRAEETQMCGRVCEDSCLECFFQPYPDQDPRYVNLEINPISTLYLAVRPNRADQVKYFSLPEGMHVEAREDGDSWSAVLFVPMSFLCETFAQPPLTTGAHLRGNFFKCGDKTPQPHFGVWAPVKAPQPDFHRPECFADWHLAD